MRDYIERLRAHPEHIRHRIALGTTVGVTAVVAVIWIATLTTSGTLALNLSAPTDNSSGTTVGGAVTQTKSNFDQLVGAIGILGASSSPASLTAVDISSTTDSGQNTDASDSGDAQNNTSQTQLSF